MLIRLFLLAFFLSIPWPALAREWYTPLHSGKAYVNPHLSVARVLKHPNPGWQGQMVLWSGRLRKVKAQGEGWTMGLETGRGVISVRCPKPVLTLKPDPREGCLVAVKGNLQYSRGRFSQLVGRSIILLQPPTWKRPGNQQDFLSQWIAFHCPDEAPGYGPKVAQAILSNSQTHKLDPILLASLLQIESAYRKDAVSTSGAVGLGQLMPFTAKGLAVDPWDPDQNVAGASKMLAGLLSGWDSPLDPRALALASYNAGPTLVRRLQTVPSYPETNNYVYFIGSVHRHLQRIGPR